MTVKKLLSSAISLGMAMALYAADAERISLGAYIANSPVSIPAEAASLLTSRMQRAITASGYGDDRATGRFALVADCDVIEKDVAPVTPPRISQTIEITFAVVDMIENKVYGSCEITVAGIGTNETKAFSTAFQKVSGQTAQLKKLLEESKNKILDYYAGSCPLIMSDAKTLASTGEFDKAIFSLMSVPSVCSDCFESCHKLAEEVYKQKIDDDCRRRLNNAQSLWASSPSGETAIEVADIISPIDPRAADFAAVVELRNEIAAKLEADAQREWNFKMKRYEDNVRFRQSIVDACRSVCEIFARNYQPPQINLNKKNYIKA